MYVGERANSVQVDVYLPSKVTMIVIQKYGQEEAFCYATVGGEHYPSVFSGRELKNNPHKNNK